MSKRQTKLATNQQKEVLMFTLKIETMTCNHCVSLISKALNQLQADIAFDIDLAAQTLLVQSEIDVSDVIAALETAGYPAQLQ